jgi:uridine phosphorylase
MLAPVLRVGLAGATLLSSLEMPAPILDDKHHDESSAFTPESLLREARRQKGLPLASVPGVCVLDPDGDIVRDLVRSGRALRDPSWACYHTDLHVVQDGDSSFGIVGGVVGASFAVLVAEELFASGCDYLVSITSAGQIARLQAPPYFVLIDRALRDEGTSYHYLPPARYAEADPGLVEAAERALADARFAVVRGSTWTTDAPFRETPSTIEARRTEGLLAVEMEAAALYAFGIARGRSVLCFAHVTNQMARTVGDFEKGAANGASEALRLIATIVGLGRPK